LDLKILNMVAYTILNPNMTDLAITMAAEVTPPTAEPPVTLVPNPPPNTAPARSVPFRRRGRGFTSNW
jgi:hypothetical protein